MPASSSSSSSTSSTADGPIYSTRFKIVAALVLTLAVAGLTTAYLVATDGTSDSISQSGGTREFVEDLIPQENTQVLQQGTVGVDLAPGWQGVLRIGGQDIPEDQLTVTSALNQVTFTPGPGKALEALTPGRTCAQAFVWRSSVGRQNGERTISWCFDVV